jgi:hypothetical protein
LGGVLLIRYRYERESWVKEARDLFLLFLSVLFLVLRRRVGSVVGNPKGSYELHVLRKLVTSTRSLKDGNELSPIFDSD